jgi:hypothetical protein
VRAGDWKRALRTARMLLAESPRRLTPALRRLLAPQRFAGGLSDTP